MTRLTVLALLLVSLSACSGDGSPTAPPTVAPPAASLFSLTGQVTGAGAALAGATVTIADGVHQGQSRATDAAGQFSFTSLSPSVFTLQAAASGYTSQNAAVNLMAANQSVAFALVKPTPIFVRSGVGDTVFDLPSYVRRVRIQGTYTRSSSNFVIYIASRLIVNELLGTSWGATTFDGTYLTSGGIVEVKLSSGVSWVMTEVR